MIETIYAMGDDAFSNLFAVNMGPISFLPSVTDAILRVQNFTIPSTGTETYEVHYKTQKITKPSGKINHPNEFSFDFRVDRYWAVYRGFVLWKNAIANNIAGTIGADNLVTNARIPISVQALDASTGLPIVGTGAWTFTGCFVQSVGDVGFDYTAGDPITVSVTMGYMALNDLTI